MTANMKDVIAGVAFIAFGLLFGLSAYNELDMGTALRMGPGYFPVVLSGLLIVIGLVVAAQAIGKDASPMTRIPWRGLILILVPPVVFGLTVRGLGFIPSVALVVVISAFASQRMGFLMAAIVTLGMTVFCTLVFLYGLGLPIQTFGPWLEW